MKKLISVLTIALLFLALGNYSFATGSYEVFIGAASQGTRTELNTALALCNTAPTAAKRLVVLANDPTAISGTVTNTNLTSLRMTSSGPWTITCADPNAIIIFDGLDNSAIDGTLLGGTLTLKNTNIAITSGCIQLSNGSSNDTIRNCTVMGAGVTTTQGGRLIFVAASLLDSQGGNNNNVIQDNTVNGGRRGIQTFGSAPLGGQLGVTNNGTIIRRNKVKNASSLAIFVGSETRDNIIESNEVFMDAPVDVGAATNFRGINCQAVGTNHIRKNSIHDLTSTDPTSTYFGMLIIPVTLTAPGSSVTTDNVINNCVTLMTDNNGFVEGITISFIAPLGYTSNVFNNTVRLAGSTPANVGIVTEAIDITNTQATSTINVCNNIAINGKTGGDPLLTLHIGLDLLAYPASGITLNSDYNIAHAVDTALAKGWDAGYDGFVYRGPGGLALYKDSTVRNVPPIEQHTAFMNVLFTGLNTCDLNLAAVGGDMCGKPLALVPDDIHGTLRNPTYPYRGAYEGPALKVLSVTVCLEGKVAGGEIQVCLYDGACNLITAGTTDINFATGKTNLCFGNAVFNGSGYYLRVKSINHLATWSALPNIVFAAGGPPNATYDFTTSPSKAFGNNQILEGTKYCIYNGDVNQDGTIDLSDGGLIDNDVFNFGSGYV
ncbi:MAG: hypothetical protein ABI840_03890, partial [bacterium]